VEQGLITTYYFQLRQASCDYPPVRSRRVRRSSIQNDRALEQRLAWLEERLQNQGRDVVSEEQTIGQPSTILSHCVQQGYKQTELNNKDGEHFMTDFMDTPSSNTLSHHGNEQDANFLLESQIGQLMNIEDEITRDSLFKLDDYLFTFDNTSALEIGVSIPSSPPQTGSSILAPESVSYSLTREMRIC